MVKIFWYKNQIKFIEKENEIVRNSISISNKFKIYFEFTHIFGHCNPIDTITT